jgi:hypothetical protein
MFDWFSLFWLCQSFGFAGKFHYSMQDGRVVKSKRQAILNTEELGEKLFKKLKISKENECELINLEILPEQKNNTITNTLPCNALILYKEPVCPKPEASLLLKRIQDQQQPSLPNLQHPIVMNLQTLLEEPNSTEEHDESDHEMELD